MLLTLIQNKIKTKISSKTVLNKDILLLIKRFFPGNKPTSHTQKILNNISNKPKPTELPVNTNKTSVNNQVPNIKSDKQTTENISNKPHTLPTKPLTVNSIKDKVPKEMPAGKYGIFNYLTNNNNQSQEVSPKKTTNVNNENKIKPSDNTLKNKSGKEFTTQITQNTNSSNITTDELIFEMRNRELIKPDTDKTAVILKDCNNNNVLLGNSKHGEKLTPLGQAYFSKVKENNDINPPTTNNTFHYDPEQAKQLQFDITFPPAKSDNLFIETGSQKHLLIVYNTITQKIFSLGYLTSKISGIFLSDTQFKNFQNNLDKKNDNDKENNLDKKNDNGEENTNQINNGKSQYFADFTSLQEIKPEDVNPVKGGKEYLAFINPFKLFKDFLEKQDNKAYTEFDKNGLTKEVCIKMCIEHDNFVKNKKPHPLTDDQIKQQTLAKNKQKEEQLKKKLKKQKENEEQLNKKNHEENS